MRKILTLIALLLAVGSCNGQTTVQKTRDGNYVAVSSRSTGTPGVKNGKTYTDTKGNVFPIWVTGKGKLYILRTSKKTGKEYKQYLKV